MANYQCGVCGSNFGDTMPVLYTNVGSGRVPRNPSCPYCGAGADGFVVTGGLQLQERAPSEPLNLPLPEAEPEPPAGTKLKDEPEQEIIKSGDEVQVNKIK